MNYVDPDGQWAIPVALGVIGAGTNLAVQLYIHDGNWDCVNWYEVASWGLYGSGLGIAGVRYADVAWQLYRAHRTGHSFNTSNPRPNPTKPPRGANAENGNGNTDVSPSTPVGRTGQQTDFPVPQGKTARNAPGNVKGRDYTGHSFDRMQQRGYTPSVIENAIKNGVKSTGNTPNTSIYTDSINKIRVITD